MNNKKWNIIFHTTKYDFVIIKNNFMMNSVDLIIKHIDEIKKENNFAIILPTTEEIRDKNTNGYLKKYLPILKEFIESKEKNILITEESLLSVLVKEEKRENFLKFLLKNNKKLVLFTEANFEETIKKITTSPCLILSEESFELDINVLDRFKNIKTIINSNFNPFNNPKGAYKLLLN